MAITSGSDALASDFIDASSGASDSGKAAKLNAAGRFDMSFILGGDGADGALSISSGTTTINLGSARYVEKNYTSISITGTGVLAFSNPHAEGTVIRLRSQGGVTITSTATRAIDLRDLGGTGGSGGGGQNNSLSMASDPGNGFLGARGRFNAWTSSPGGVGGPGGAAGSSMENEGGGGGAYGSGFGTGRESIPTASMPILPWVLYVLPGGGGAGGFGGNANGFTGGNGGNGGRGAGALIIECAGAYNFGASSTIDGSGTVGSNGTAGTVNGGGGGGGGGGATILVIYASLTADAGTYTVTGGAGGSNGGGGAGNGSTGGTGVAKRLAWIF